MIRYDLKALKLSLDRLWSQRIKMRGKCCLKCGKVDRLQAAHIFSRSQKSVRWDLDNGIALCSGHHLFWAHKNPVEFAEFVKEQIGEQKYDKLRLKARTLIKVDRLFLEKTMLELQSFNTI